MKKTMIALAAVAAVGAASAQNVNLTGGIGFAFLKDVQDRTTGSAAHGLVNSAAYIDVSVSEDLGNGYKAAAFMEFNQDGGFGARAYGDTKSLTLTTPMGVVSLANTRSGGNQAAGMVGPVSLWNGAFDVGNVISRTPIDALSFTMPLATGLTGRLAYTEAYNTTYTPNPYNAAIGTGGFGAGDGNQNAGVSTYTGNLTYAAGPLKISANYNQSTITDEWKAALAALAVSDARLVSYDISGIYDAGVAKFGLSIDGPRRAKQNGTDETAYLMGVSVPMGAWTMGGNYALRGITGGGTNSLFNVGATYDLSKRTSMNASWGTYTTAGKALNGTDLVQDTYRVTMNHSF